MSKSIIGIFISILSIISLIGCEGFSITGGPGSNAGPHLTSRVTRQEDLLTINTIELLPVAVERSASNVTAEVQFFSQELSRIAERELALEIIPKTAKTQADAVLHTTLSRFDKRVGTSVAATTPASVSFNMEIVRNSDRKTVWSAQYAFHDESLAENLFKLEQRFSADGSVGWKEATDLLSNGFTEALQDFNERRLLLFSEGKLKSGN